MDVMVVDMDWHYTYKDMHERLGPDDFGQTRWVATPGTDLFPTGGISRRTP